MVGVDADSDHATPFCHLRGTAITPRCTITTAGGARMANQGGRTAPATAASGRAAAANAQESTGWKEASGWKA